jgi:hypothetical protein
LKGGEDLNSDTVKRRNGMNLEIPSIPGNTVTAAMKRGYRSNFDRVIDTGAMDD